MEPNQYSIFIDKAYIIDNSDYNQVFYYCINEL